MDIFPGLKTQVTATLTALFDLLALFDVVQVTPEQFTHINGLALALIGLFLALKVQRQRR